MVALIDGSFDWTPYLSILRDLEALSFAILKSVLSAVLMEGSALFRLEIFPLLLDPDVEFIESVLCRLGFELPSAYVEKFFNEKGNRFLWSSWMLDIVLEKY